MFHQVLFTPEDRGALCYLWCPDGDLSKDPKTHQMLVHIFGAKSSPSVTSFALRITARDNADKFPSELVEAVLRDFYVDDLLKSFQSASEATATSSQLCELLSKGGFELTKWLSNNREVMQTFQPEDLAPSFKDLNLDSDEPRSQKVYPEARRGVLASVADVYDPWGLASPFILPGRQINQLCGLKYGWDENLSPDLLLRRRTWKEGVHSHQSSLHIPRCFPPGFGRMVRTDIHHFADASQDNGYGAVTYLRLENKEGRIHCSFVFGKSRVKPLRSSMTVPKLDLTAATLMTQMNELKLKELEGRVKVDKVFYCLIVLRYDCEYKKKIYNIRRQLCSTYQTEVRTK
ncbi:uncharacterized protein LOC125563209 [Nematostella vectensis]|uniref:uncharacterized protein LOC125563209 n=1 Tax=Nematostella vectensis TaxID=45351 RepID=UPI002076F901|nr:uncharacterized protein LOC125563209 [Nematostella vectensis]